LKKRESKKIESKELVADGYLNLMSRTGIGANNMISQYTYGFTMLTHDRMRLESMYRGSWIVGAVIDSVAEDMTRGGVSITGSIDPDKIAKIQTKLTRLGVWRAILESIKWGRLYGGAIAAIVIDGQDPSTPLDISTVSNGQFRGLKVYDRWALSASNTVVEFGMDAGLPVHYDVIADISTKKLSGVRWHHSRVIRFVGIQLPVWQAMQTEYWGESVIERMNDRIVAFDAATMGASNLVEKAHLRVLMIKGLRDTFQEGGHAEEILSRTFNTMRQLQSNEGLTVLDGEDSYQPHSYSFGGLSDIILQFGQQISGATGIPLVRLFGQSPAGLNSTGESDLRMYYDHILSQQESRLREGMLLVLRVMYRSLFGQDAPDDFDFDFSPLWQTSEREKADISSVVTDTIIKAYDAGIIDQVTAMKELRQSSEATGIYSNITQESIEEAEMAPPPMPVENVPIETTPLNE
jgi:phage-related protein (TIGR01555 family)